MRIVSLDEKEREREREREKLVGNLRNLRTGESQSLGKNSDTGKIQNFRLLLLLLSFMKLASAAVVQQLRNPKSSDNFVSV